MSDAVGVVVTVQGNSVQSLDLAFPDLPTVADITSNLRAITQWTGWALGQPQIDSAAKVTSVKVALTEPGQVQQGVLNDVVWPLVAALAEHGRLCVTVMGAQVSTAPLKIDNRFVTLEQSGGQGVQSYQVSVKDANFKNLDELRQQEPAAAPSATGSRPHPTLTWLMVIIISLVAGMAVYLWMGRSGQKK
jgi:hypothetical protein